MIARQHLVGALSVQQHCDAVLFRKPHHAPLRIHARRRERLLLMPEETLQLFKELFRAGPDVVALYSIAPGNKIHPLAFISRWIVEPRGECLLHGAFRQESIDDADDRAGVEAARQTGSDGYVCAEPQANGADQVFAELFGITLIGPTVDPDSRIDVSSGAFVAARPRSALDSGPEANAKCLGKSSVHRSQPGRIV